MPSSSHPDLTVATVGDLVDEGEVVPHQDELLDIPVDDEVEDGEEQFLDGSSDTSGISEANSAVCSDKGETLFSPPLYLQMYQPVLCYLSNSSVHSVLNMAAPTAGS